MSTYNRKVFAKVKWEEEGHVIFFGLGTFEMRYAGICESTYNDLLRCIESVCSLDGKRLVYIDGEGDEVSECENCDGKGISSPPIRPRGEYVIIVISWWHCFDFAVALFRGPEKHLEIDCPTYGQYHSCVYLRNDSELLQIRKSVKHFFIDRIIMKKEVLLVSFMTYDEGKASQFPYSLLHRLSLRILMI